MRRPDSIRARMTILFTLAIAALLLLAGGSILARARYAASREADRVLQLTARNVRADLVEEGGLTNPEELFREEGEALDAADGAMLIVDAHGRVLQRSRRQAPHWPRPPDDGWRVMTVPAGDRLVVLGLPWWKTERALLAEATSLLRLSLVGLLVVAGGSWLLVGHTLSPIGQLARQASAASVEDLCLRLQAPSPDREVVDLVSTFNLLLERLSEHARAKGRFYAAASHELRTPLQALSGHLELCLTRRRTNEDYQAVVREAYLQTRRLISLVRDLLTLNRLESATVQPEKEAVNLGDVCARALAPLRPAILERRVRLSAHLPDDVEILAPPAHAEMIVRNLIDNAVKYAPTGTVVAVRVISNGAADGLEVYNDFPAGVVLPPDQLFEPFFRADPSRSSRTGGNGLGLAICRAITVANGWNLSWRQEGAGVRATVLF